MSPGPGTLHPIVVRHRAEILALAEQHGARRVRVFGSMARGDATDDSDVDLLIVPGPDRSPFFPGGLIADLEDLLGRAVQVVSERALHPALRDRVLAEAQPL